MFAQCVLEQRPDFSRLSYIRELYNSLAGIYVQLYGSESFRKYCHVLEILQEYLKWSGREVAILDAGCGVGIGLTYLLALRKSVRVVGLDVSIDSLRHAVVLAEKTGIDLVAAILEMLPFRDNVFDVLVTVAVLDVDHKLNLKLQLQESRRVTRSLQIHISSGQEYRVWIERKT